MQGKSGTCGILHLLADRSSDDDVTHAERCQGSHMKEACTMNPRTAGAVAISLVAAGLLVNSGRRDGNHRRIARGRGSSLDRESLNELIAAYRPARVSPRCRC